MLQQQISTLFGPLAVILVLLVSSGASSSIGKGAGAVPVGEQANEVITSAGDSVLGSSNNNNNVLGSENAQYRANYYYAQPSPVVGNAKTVASAGNRNVLWNRDSYTEAAQEYGYGLDSAQAYGAPHQGGYQAQYGAHSHNTPNVFSNNDSGDGGIFDLDSVGTSLSGIGGFGGGLGGLGGLLGLKGLKGLGLLGLLKFGWPALLLILGLPLLIFAPLLLLFLPIPIITIPTSPNGRTFGPFRFADFSTKMTDLARSVLESDKCIERMSCEISRFSRGTFIDKALTRAIQRFEPQMPTSLRRMARAYMDPASCRRYTCSLMGDESHMSKKKST